MTEKGEKSIKPVSSDRMASMLDATASAEDGMYADFAAVPLKDSGKVLKVYQDTLKNLTLGRGLPENSKEMIEARANAKAAALKEAARLEEIDSK